MFWYNTTVLCYFAKIKVHFMRHSGLLHVVSRCSPLRAGATLSGLTMSVAPAIDRIQLFCFILYYRPTCASALSIGSSNVWRVYMDGQSLNWTQGIAALIDDCMGWTQSRADRCSYFSIGIRSMRKNDLRDLAVTTQTVTDQQHWDRGRL